MIENAYNVVRQARPDRPDVLMHLGDDHTGRALEVGAVVIDDGGLLVIHAMDMRERFRQGYEEGRRRKGDCDG